jgi:hypothetical protein
VNQHAKTARRTAHEAVRAIDRGDYRAAADLLADAQLAAENAATEQEQGPPCPDKTATT